jgi:hypothetical protein
MWQDKPEHIVGTKPCFHMLFRKNKNKNKRTKDDRSNHSVTPWDEPLSHHYDKLDYTS